MSDWSLQKELCKAAGCKRFKAALVKLNLIGSINEPFELSHDTEWIRGGAETYIYRFWIRHPNGKNNGYIVKAVVAFSPNRSIDGILQEWIERRNILSDNGISTPDLITYGNGIIIEELIPFTLRQVLQDADNRSFKQILIGLTMVARTLSHLGFQPIDAFKDIHSRNKDVVMIDFGEDLGPYGLSRINVRSRDRIFDKLVSTLTSWKLGVSQDLINELRTIYYTPNSKSLH